MWIYRTREKTWTKTIKLSKKIMNLKWKNGTKIIPYAEIKVSFQQYLFWSIVVGRLFSLFEISSLVVLKIVWAYDNWFSSITTISYVLQLPTKLKYVYSNYKWVNYPVWILFSTTILNYTWKVFRLTREIFSHDLQSFQDCILYCALHYICIYNMTYIACITSK